MPLTQRFVALLGCVFPLLSAFAQTPPLKLAPAARFELSGEGSVSTITDADLLKGHGTLARPSGRAGQELTRHYSVEFPVFHFATNGVVLRFVPKGSGPVRLRLSGFRDSFTDRVLFKEEVYWHRVDVEGASIPAEVLAEKPLPLRTWNQEATELSILVTRDVPVIVRVAAQAVSPVGWQEMKPLRSKLTRAHLAAGRFSKGVTLRRFLDVAADDPQRLPIADAEIASIRREGFDHIRLPVAWHLHLQKDTGTTIPKELFTEVEQVITAARKHGLSVVLGFHGFNELVKNPVSGTARFFVLWEQISQRFTELTETLAFELLDEPGGEVPTKSLMSLYAEVVPMIRAHSSHRTLFVAPSGAGNFASLAKMNLPESDDNLIVTIDCADPVLFTQQGRSSAPFRGVLFPGPPDTPLVPVGQPVPTAEQSRWLNRYNQRSADRNPSSPSAFRELIALARQWSVYYGRPIYFGEVGCHAKSDPLSRARYYYSFRTALEKSDVGWSILGWKDDFRYWVDSEGRPEPGLKDALFARVQPAWVADRFQFNLSAPASRSAPLSLGLRRWWSVALAAGVVCFGLLVLAVRTSLRRRRPQEAVPLVISETSVPFAHADVLPAEAGREGMLRQLTRLMMETAIPRLVGQKRELIRVQERAAQDLADLDRRLEAVHAPLQNRLNAYQRRIVELEHQLALKGLENKELIQAKIQVTKERLEAARARDALLLSKHSLN